jgi:hypothetical protein
MIPGGASRLRPFGQRGLDNEEDQWWYGEISWEHMVYIYIWVNYNDLTATSLEFWLIREIIPKWA